MTSSPNSNNAPIYLTREDYDRLRLFVATALQSGTTAPLEKLRQELDRATVVDASGIPAGVVTMESRVEYEDVASGEVEAYTITFPDRANVEQKRLSILAPIGTALIGCREGDIITWSTPGGVRQLKIRRVTPPAAPPAVIPALN